jgi:hypothetical protein
MSLASIPRSPRGDSVTGESSELIPALLLELANLSCKPSMSEFYKMPIRMMLLNHSVILALECLPACWGYRLYVK